MSITSFVILTPLPSVEGQDQHLKTFRTRAASTKKREFAIIIFWVFFKYYVNNFISRNCGLCTYFFWIFQNPLFQSEKCLITSESSALFCQIASQVTHHLFDTHYSLMLHSRRRGRSRAGPSSAFMQLYRAQWDDDLISTTQKYSNLL